MSEPQAQPETKSLSWERQLHPVVPLEAFPPRQSAPRRSACPRHVACPASLGHQRRHLFRQQCVRLGGLDCVTWAACPRHLAVSSDISFDSSAACMIRDKLPSGSSSGGCTWPDDARARAW
eukprot:350406-Chlamydomonas_euryale.AAC.3